MTRHKRRRQSRHLCPLCAEPRPNTGLPLTIPFGIPTYWSPEAALAIFEFVDEMREIILGVYGTHIQDAARQYLNVKNYVRVTLLPEQAPAVKNSGK